MVNLKLDIPTDFLKEEVRWNHVISTKTKELWAVELDLAVELRRACNKHNLRFALSSGSLLGAVRHKGFIPWDDDLDLMMPRQDYEKLCAIAHSEFGHPYYFECFRTDPTFPYCYAKLMNVDTTFYENKCVRHHGIYIDIFPYDNIIDDDVLLAKQGQGLVKLFKELQRISFCDANYYKESGISFARKMARLLIYCKKQLFNIKPGGKTHMSIFNKYEELVTRYNNVATKYMGPLSIYHINCENLILSEDVDSINSFIPMDFEFLEFPGLRHYHENLTSRYGDYMQPVKGSSWHKLMEFDTDKPYYVYFKEKGMKNFILPPSLQ